MKWRWGCCCGKCGQRGTSSALSWAYRSGCPAQRQDGPFFTCLQADTRGFPDCERVAGLGRVNTGAGGCGEDEWLLFASIYLGRQNYGGVNVLDHVLASTVGPPPRWWCRDAAAPSVFTTSCRKYIKAMPFGSSFCAEYSHGGPVVPSAVESQQLEARLVVWESGMCRYFLIHQIYMQTEVLWHTRHPSQYHHLLAKMFGQIGFASMMPY